ncbi:MAG TPA: hypothetical protein VM639_10495 [Dongiaceae bacterium]|nr:hypothetical protein [Dongiaceae bacterium]
MRHDDVGGEIRAQLDSGIRTRLFQAGTFWGGLLLSGFMLTAAVMLAS